MSPSPDSFRVIVLQPTADGDRSGKDLASALADRVALSEDARIALEAGRSAVISSAVTEQYARRVATQVMKLGIEVRIEPEEGEGAGLRAGAAPLLPRTATPTVATPPPPFPPEPHPDRAPPSDTIAGEGRGDATEPVLLDRPRPWEDAPSGIGRTASSAAAHPTQAPPSEAAPAEPGAPRAALASAGPGDVSHPGEARLVRCPAHGLLYDASKSNGCSRCLGETHPSRARLLPTLRARPRLWLATGVLLALGLGAVPAVIYTQQVKSGSLLERRIEAEAIRRGRAGSPEGRAAYLDACAHVDRTRARAVAVTALIWLVSTIFLLLLYRRFV